MFLQVSVNTGGGGTPASGLRSFLGGTQPLVPDPLQGVAQYCHSSCPWGAPGQGPLPWPGLRYPQVGLGYPQLGLGYPPLGRTGVPPARTG